MDQELTLQDANYLNKEDKRTLALSSLGGALEFYDFVIYVFYAKIISDLFFPSTLSPFWAMLNTYGIFAAGYFFRPLGGVVMAHFGDLVGRKKLFSLSILLEIKYFSLGPPRRPIKYFFSIKKELLFEKTSYFYKTFFILSKSSCFCCGMVLNYFL